MGLLHDMLRQALAEPQSALTWHMLHQVWLQTQEAGEKSDVLNLLQSHSQPDPRADILRLTFLADTGRDPRHAHEAAARVLALTPANPDRLATFMMYPWFGAFASPTRDHLAADLIGAQLPSLARSLGQMARAMAPAALKPRVPRSIKRVALVMPYLGNRMHTPSVMMKHQCALLAKSGLDVRVFSCQEHMIHEAWRFRGSARRLRLPVPEADYWSKALPPGVQLHFSDSRFSLDARWQGILARIAQFDPDVVMLVGFYSPLAAALHAFRPLVGLSIITLPPMVPLDVWLTGNENPLPSPWGTGLGWTHAHFHPYRLPEDTGPWTVTRAEIGVPDDAQLWITAGFRLEGEIQGEWAARMLTTLEAHPKAVWLLVGGAGKLPAALNAAPPGRIIPLSTRTDLGGILRLSDLYLNPPRIGGGFSVAEAMAARLPVLTLAGSDGGDKVGDRALADLDAYFLRLDQLNTDSDLRRREGQALRERFSQRYDLAASGPSLLNALEAAVRTAAPRLNLAAS